MEKEDGEATVALLQDDLNKKRRKIMQTLPLETGSSILSFLQGQRQNIAIAMGPLCCLLILAFVKITPPTETPSNEHPKNKAVEMLAVTIWVAVWWITEAIPVAITSLVPMLMFPLFEIMDANTVAGAYMNDTITLFIGSFILSIAVEEYNAHKRIALKTLLIFGGKSMNPRMLLLGFCVGPAFVSMWIANTATAIMMLPMCTGVLKRLHEQPGVVSGEHDHDEENAITTSKDMGTEVEAGKTMMSSENGGELDYYYAQQYARAVVLGIAFSVCIGGLTTLTGTGTNLVFLAIWSSCFPEAPAVTYLQWFMFAFPLGLLMLLFCWLFLCVYFCPRAGASSVSSRLNRSSIEEELKSLGKMGFAEATVLGLFMILVVLWLTRSLGNSSGWGVLFHNFPADGTASILLALFVFIIPNRIKAGERLLSWSHCKKIPWKIVLLFGGGFAIAAGFKSSGLSEWVTQYLDFLNSTPELMVAPLVAILVAVVTEFTSNNATATIFLPLLAQAALSAKLHPLLLMVSGTIAASFSFMLPISTPPMALAFSSGHVRMFDMIFTGFVLKCAGIFLLFALMPGLGTYVFQLQQPFNGTT